MLTSLVSVQLPLHFHGCTHQEKLTSSWPLFSSEAGTAVLGDSQYTPTLGKKNLSSFYPSHLLVLSTLLLSQGKESSFILLQFISCSFRGDISRAQEPYIYCKCSAFARARDIQQMPIWYNSNQICNLNRFSYNRGQIIFKTYIYWSLCLVLFIIKLHVTLQLIIIKL